MKVGIFVEDISYGGGLEIVSMRLCRAFNQKGIDAEIISFKEQSLKFRCNENYAKFDFTAKQLENQNVREFIAKKLKVDNFTHIIFQTSAPYSLFSNILFYKAVRAREIKTYVVFHTSIKTVVVRHFHKREPFAEFVLKCAKTAFYNIPRSKKFFKNSSDAVDSFVSLSSGNALELTHYFKKKSVVIPNYFEPLNFNVDFTKKEKTFIYVGRIDKEQKNIFYLIDAWKKLQNKNGWSFVVVGPDSNDKKISEQMMKNNIQVISYANNNLVLKYLKTSSVLLLASIYEGFPTVVLEAVANGNAIISTKYDGFSKEIIHDGENGFVIEDKLHSKKFSKAMQSLIFDTKMLLEMQKRSLDLYKEYIKTDVVELWKKEFEK